MPVRSAFAIRQNGFAFLTKKQVANNGVLPQHYFEGNHEAIIAPETFELVQREIARRREKKDRYSGMDIEAKLLLLSVLNKLELIEMNEE